MKFGAFGIFSIMVAVAALLLMSGDITAAPKAGQAEPRVKVLIGFTQQPGPPEQALVHQAGGNIKYTYHLVPAIAAAVPESAIDGLLNNPRITYIEADGWVQANGKKEPTNDALVWGVDRIDAEHVWGGAEDAIDVAAELNSGAGIDVAIIDSCIDLEHPDLANNIKGDVTFVDGTANGDYDNGHGSHVAGIVAALDNGEGVIGVAPKANLYAVKVLNKYNGGYFSDVVAGIEWAAGLNGGTKVDVINMSLETGVDSQTLRDAVAAAYGAGVLLVASAGNGGTCAGGEDTVKYPGRYPQVMAVTATDSSDGRPCFASTGADVELAAPGDAIYSTYKDGRYSTLSGGSMASPHVAGTAALVWAAYPGWSHDEVRAHLQGTAEDIGLPATGMGHGLVDAQAAAAVVASDPVATSSVSGAVTKAADGTAIGGATVSVDTGQSATTAADGSYTIADVPTGDRQVTALAADLDSQTKTATVIENQPASVNFALSASDGGSDGGPPPCKGKNKKEPGCP